MVPAGTSVVILRAATPSVSLVTLSTYSSATGGFEGLKPNVSTALPLASLLVEGAGAGLVVPFAKR
jgi:hypothetical protein